MSDKALLIQVTVFDPKTHEVLTQAVEHYDGSYGFEVEQTFDELGKRFAKVIDPTHD